MFDKPFDDLKAYENMIKDNEKSLSKSYNDVNSLQEKYSNTMNAMTNLKEYDDKLKKNVLESMA